MKKLGPEQNLINLKNNYRYVYLKLCMPVRRQSSCKINMEDMFPFLTPVDVVVFFLFFF